MVLYLRNAGTNSLHVLSLLSIVARIDPKEYMQAGWDSSPHLAVHPYKKGSRHNKVGMWIMWTYYVLFTGMAIRLIWVLNT